MNPESSSTSIPCVAVIGAGRISEEHLRFLNVNDQTRLAAVCDLSAALAQFAADRFLAERAYTDHRRMLDEIKPDVVHVLTPPHTHMAIARDCLDADAHLIIEKPITTTNAELHELWDHAQQAGKLLIEDHNVRFSKPIQKIEKLIATGELGEVREAEVRLALDIASAGSRYADKNLPHPSHKLPAGVIHEFLPHLCYTLLRFIPDFDRVSAAWSRHGDNDVFKYDDLDAIIVAGPVHGRLRFTCHTAPACFMVIVRGTRAWVETDLYHPYLRITKPRMGGKHLTPFFNQLANGLHFIKSGFGDIRDKVLQRQAAYEGLAVFLQRTYDALRQGTEQPVSFEDMDLCSRFQEALLNEENRV